MINKNVGIIGYGSMGKMLLNGFTDSKIIDRSHLFISTKTKEKLLELDREGYSVCQTNDVLVDSCEIIFICTKPLEVYKILDEIKNVLSPEKHIVSIAGSVSIQNLEKMSCCKVTKVLPTLISYVKKGVTLVCHNGNVCENDKLEIKALMGAFSRVEYAPENEFDFISQLTSCAPGLFAAIFKEYVKTTCNHSGLSSEKVASYVLETLTGTVHYLESHCSDFDDMVHRVATKGGTTEVGVQVLEKKLPDVFGEMFEKTLQRQRDRKSKVEEQYI